MYIEQFISSLFTFKIRRAVYYVIADLKSKKNYLKKRYNLTEDEVDKIYNIDPTPDKRYADWISNIIKTDKTLLNNTDFTIKLQKTLGLYNEAIKRPDIVKSLGLSKHIEDYKTLEELENSLQRYMNIKPIVNPSLPKIDIKPFKVYTGKEVKDKDPKAKWEVYLIDNYHKSRELCENLGVCIRYLQYYRHYSDEGFISFYYITRNNKVIAIVIPNKEIRGPFNDPVKEEYVNSVKYILKDLGIPINFGGFNIKVPPKSTEELIKLYKKNPNINYLIKENPELASDELLEKFIKDYYNSYGKLPDLPDNVNKDIVNKIEDILEDIKNTKDIQKGIEYNIGFNYLLKHYKELDRDTLLKVLRQVKYIEKNPTIDILEEYKDDPEIIHEVIIKGPIVDEEVAQNIPLNPAIIGAAIHANVMSDTLLNRIKEEYKDNPGIKNTIFNTAAKELRNPILIKYIENVTDDKAVRTFIKNNLELIIEMPSISVSNRSIERVKEALGENSPMYKLVHLKLRPEKKIDVTNLDIDKIPEKFLMDLYQYQKLSPEQIDKAIKKGKNLFPLYVHQKLSPEQIDKAMEKGKNLFPLYVHQKLSPKQIDKAIEKGEELSSLYQYQKLSPEQIDKAIEKGEGLSSLYQYQKLSPEQIDKAMEKGKNLFPLYIHQKLSPEQIDKAMEKEENLEDLYEHQELSPEQIDKAIEKGIYLYNLYIYKNLSPEQIDKAMEKGKYLYDLYIHQKLSPKQIDKAIEKGIYLYNLYIYKNLSPEQIDKAMEKGEELSSLYQYQKLSPEQIDKAIEKGKDLYNLYKYQELSPEQIDKAIEKGEGLDNLYRYKKLSPEQIDKAIEKGEYLYNLYEYQKLSPENINKAIEKGIHLYNLYEYQKLSPENINKAIEKGKELYILYGKYKLTPEQIDKAIEKGKYLGDLRTYQKNNITPEQLLRLREKLTKKSYITNFLNRVIYSKYDFILP